MVLKEYFEVRFVHKFGTFKNEGQGYVLNQTESSCLIIINIIMTDDFLGASSHLYRRMCPSVTITTI